MLQPGWSRGQMRCPGPRAGEVTSISCVQMAIPLSGWPVSSGGGSKIGIPQGPCSHPHPTPLPRSTAERGQRPPAWEVRGKST